ncbi:MAG: hypothetical protein ACKVU2_17535 [Saprospiraceae bacterium]
MKKNVLTLLFALGAAVCGHAQYLPSLLPVQPLVCPYSPGTLVFQPEAWHIYQTTDGHWNGPVDSARCISATTLPFNLGIEIDLKQVNPTEPLFLRARLDSFPPFTAFDVDFLYNAKSSARIVPGTLPLIRTTADCPDDLCTGIILGIAIPDANGQPGAATRFHTALADVYPTFPNSFKGIDAGACFPTERFPDQRLREYILKFTFADTVSLDNAQLQVFFADVEPDPWGPQEVAYITDVLATSNPFPIDAAASGFGSHFLGLYTAPTYPGPQTHSYIEALPVPNTTVPQNITLTVEDHQTLEMQPFAQFRGGLVSGSSTQRHQLTLQNNGGDLCMNFVDLIFDNGDALHHSGGQITMNNTFSCMQFKHGSEFRVKEGASLHYGNNGAGMLVICANSTIALERNATLVVDALFQISECDENLPPNDIVMDLPPGSRLVFTENAWLTNRFSKDKKMHLNVRMLGGTLDDAALPADARALIRRIYPEPAPNWADNVLVWPNPFTESPTIQYLAGSDEQVRLRWMDTKGRMLLEETRYASKGLNTWKPLVPQQNESGLYFLEISAPGGRTIRKLVRTD